MKCEVSIIFEAETQLEAANIAGDMMTCVFMHFPNNKTQAYIPDEEIEKVFASMVRGVGNA
jgi:hypothetical protein